jgi:hypothetical protein
MWRSVLVPRKYVKQYRERYSVPLANRRFDFTRWCRRQ